MKQYKSQVIFLIVATVFLGITFLPLFANERILDAFGREDGIFENLTALYLFITSILFGVAFFRFLGSSWLLRLSCAGLALIFFLGAGEEISWGERIFGWTEQNFIRERNVQGELTLHNLEYFQGDDSLLPVSISQLFVVFTFIFAVLLPLVCVLWPRVKSFIAPRFPVMPLYPGLLVVITYAFQKAMLRLLPMFPALYQHPSMPIPQGVHEIREHGYTFALLAGAIVYFSREWKARRIENSRVSQAELTNPGPVMPVGIENKGEKI